VGLMHATNSLSPAYTAFCPEPFRLTMGLVPLDLQDWINPDEHLAQDLFTKAQLLQERHQEVFVALPEAAAASAEVLALLAAYLPARFPAHYRRVGDRLDNLATGERWDLLNTPLHPLDLAGRLVQEDLCLMQRPEGQGVYRLVGASVCFPTRWRLREKIGKSIGAIHAPVPGYDTQLAANMDRFFSRMKTERPVWRLNWSLVNNPALFQPTGHGRCQPDASITVYNAADRLWLRMERQTLRRLPQTHDILFTIRVHVHPLRHLAAQPEQAKALAVALRALPPAILQYKSLQPFRHAVLTWLDRVAS
jgi:hypothetical protein